MEHKEGNIPIHTRFGLRLLQGMLIVFVLFLVKRCVYIYHENILTNELIEMEYFEKGFASSMKKSRGGSEDQKPQFKNYAF